MNLRTFGQVKTDISRVCGATGMPATDPRVKEFTNLAVQELLNEGDFPWTVDRLRFRVCDGRIVVPSCYDRIISMSVDGIAQQINSPWYETTVSNPWDGWGYNSTTGFGWFGENWYWGQNAGMTLDRDEIFQFRDIPCGNWRLRISTQFVQDENAYILIKGYDADKNPVTTVFGGEHIEGEKILLSKSPQITTSTFSELSGIVKPVTNGEVYVYAIDDSARYLHIATFAPGDETPYYRSYKVVGNPWCRAQSILARLRKRYVPILTDDDFVMCGNIPALKKMVQAVWYSDAGDIQKYALYKAAAVDILKKEAMAFRGKTRLPALTMQKGFGVGQMPFIR